MRAKILLPELLLVLVTACSLANREGPDATCADLDSGAVNACQEGIIATCKSATMRYEVCSDKEACSAAWQEPGRYRCNEADNLPIPVMSTGGSSSGGSGSNKTGGGGSSCDPTGPCPVAKTSGSDIDWYTVDAQNAYFSDCETVWSSPKSGAFTTALATGLKGCSYGNVEIDATDLYVTEHQDNSANSNVVRIHKTDGSLDRVVTTTGTLGPLASDDRDLYWLAGFDIKTAPKLGGTEEVVTSINSGTKRLLARGGFLYWTESDSIGRVELGGTYPATPSVMSVGNQPEDFTVGTEAAFFTVRAEGLVARLPLTGGAWSELASSQPAPTTVATAGSEVFWVSIQQSTEIRKANVTGGSPALVAKTSVYQNVGRIVADDTHVYWSQGSDLMRAPR